MATLTLKQTRTSEDYSDQDCVEISRDWYKQSCDLMPYARRHNMTRDEMMKVLARGKHISDSRLKAVTR